MKTKEKILGGLFIMLTLLFIGCRQSITPDEKLSLEKEKQEQRESREREEFLLEQIGKEIDVERFIVINLGKDCTYILLDKHMRTMYLMKKSASSFRASGFMSLLVDSLGKPILYRGELPEQRESREREESLLEQIRKEIDVERFIVINLGKDCTYILLDKHMRTMYLMKKSASSFRASGFMSLLVDSLGKPILYRGELPEYGKIEVSGNSRHLFGK